MLPVKKPNSKGREGFLPTPAPLTSVVLHSSVVGDALWPKTEAQDITRIRAVSHQERTIWFPFQLHLCIFPIHWSPIPTTLSKIKSSQVINRTEKCQSAQHNYLTTEPHFQNISVGKSCRSVPTTSNTCQALHTFDPPKQQKEHSTIPLPRPFKEEKRDPSKLICHNQVRLCKHFSTPFLIIFNSTPSPSFNFTMYFMELITVVSCFVTINRETRKLLSL